MSDHFPFVSVIVPFYDPLELAKSLPSILGQTYPIDRFEVMAIDNGPFGISEEMRSSFPTVKFFSEKSPGSYAARNKGISESKGEILAYTDSDCFPEVSWIEKGVSAVLSKGKNIVIGGRVKFIMPKKHSAAGTFDSLHGLNQESMIENFGFALTANLFAPKEIFNKVGGFDQEYMSGGDKLWGKKALDAGFKIEYDPETIVWHPTARLEGILRRRMRFAGAKFKETNLKPRKEFIRFLQVAWDNIKPPSVPLPQGIRIQLETFIIKTLIVIVSSIEFLRLWICATKPVRR
jgi:glycosyltransferase involved in cell wall biosynthesis